jgi:hypothetical protein
MTIISTISTITGGTTTTITSLTIVRTTLFWVAMQ